LNVLAVVAATTTAPVEPLTTTACNPGQGSRTVIVVVEPTWIAVVTSGTPSEKATASKSKIRRGRYRADMSPSCTQRCGHADAP
jgi:hypothetical protein